MTPRRYPVALATAMAVVLLVSACATAPDSTVPTSPSALPSASTTSPTPTVVAPTYSAASSAPATPQANAFAPLAMIRAVNPGISLRAAPGTSAVRLGSLAEGSRSVVVDGPLQADGMSWYRLSAPGLPPASGCMTPIATEPFGCSVWLGWAATGPANDWFVADPTNCPDPSTDLRAFAMLGDFAALHCAGDEEMQIVGWLHEYPTTPEPTPCPAVGISDAPDWLWCHARFWEALYVNQDEAVFIDLFVDPDSGVVLPHDGRWVSVTGHMDDPRAADCDKSIPAGWPVSPDTAIPECRARFVVTDLADASAP